MWEKEVIKKGAKSTDNATGGIVIINILLFIYKNLDEINT
jgi:hypothetical protein